MRTAAFYDLDGTLMRGNVVSHYHYFARTDASWAGKARRFAESALMAPGWMALDWLDRRSFNEVFYRAYVGLSEDRLVILGEELFETELMGRIFPGARSLVDGDRRAGHVTVLVTGALDVVAEPVARYLGFDHWVAMRLEFDAEGLASGRLLPPVIAGPGKVAWVRQFAREEEIDLESSRAYSDDIADLPFLSAVGRPTAVNPDLRLRAAARSHGWPVLMLEDQVTWPRKLENLEERLGSLAVDARHALEVGSLGLRDGLGWARRVLRERSGRESIQAPHSPGDEAPAPAAGQTSDQAKGRP
jgi:HAD superfamily hydrolase (TIGR01490 family)